MTPKQRFLAALRNEVPDRVPASPDFSNYVPCKRTGLPFWDIYFYEKIPLWRAYLNAVDHFGTEAWMASCTGAPVRFAENDVEVTVEDTYREEMDAMVRTTECRTPKGTLTSESTCMRYDPPSPTQKPMKDLARDWETFKAMQAEPIGLDEPHIAEMKQACKEREQAFGLAVSYPGFHMWETVVQGGVEQLSYAMMDCPELLDEWFELDLDRGTKILQLLLDAEPDYILFGGSGTITMASPQLAEQYAIPALKKWSKIAKEAGVPTHLHSCGKSRVLIDMLCDETDIGSINPLEHPPMGDVDLAEVKQARGAEIGLMGNLHTTEVMLRGAPETVQRKSLEAMAAAGAGGGFILSTGDQCGRDTPEENLFALRETAEKYGVYDDEGRLPAVDQVMAEMAG